jgi:hypothetical protein
MARNQWAAGYPVLLAAYPVMAALGHNVDQVELAVGLRPLAVSLIGAALLLGIYRLVLRDWHKAAALCALSVLLFFSYGHVYRLVEGFGLAGMTLGRHRFLLPVWLGTFVLGSWWIIRRRDLSGFTRGMGWVTLAALAIPVVQVVRFHVWRASAAASLDSDSSNVCDLRLEEGREPPDVYYIILDGYMRDDVLREVSGYDNSPFLEELGGMGFEVARGSQSNYPFTMTSLASSLNLDYVQSLFEPAPGDSRSELEPLVRRNLVRRELECLGYRTIAFETGFQWTQWQDADLYLRPSTNLMDSLFLRGGLSDFEMMVLEGSLGLAVIEGNEAVPGFIPGMGELHQGKRELILFALDELPDLASSPGPMFVFAHIVSPHPPFLFDANGGRVSDEEINRLSESGDWSGRDPFWMAYAEQVQYLNSRILEDVRLILERSATPPIIVIQGDHGYLDDPRQARVLILNAYYLPGDGGEVPYDTISPVNTFRLIFDRYFGGDFPLLEDISYYSVNGDFGFERLPYTWSASSGSTLGARDVSD